MAVVKGDVVEFRALQLANEHRNAYGLRSNDYERYRKHCGNRTHRLRSTLKMTHGKGRDFKKLPPITLDNIKAGHLQLLLFETERAWAYSQELNAASQLPANEDRAAVLRSKATARFRRSVHWCTQMLSHCQSLFGAKRMSAENMLEVTAFTLLLSGRFLRYRDEFEDALDQLCVTKDLLDVLAAKATTSHDQALATLFADSISPEIRHCAHELGHTKSYDIDGIVKSTAPKRREELVDGYDALVKKYEQETLGESKEGRKRLKPLMWEGKEVLIRNPELVDVLLNVQHAEEKLREFHSKGDAKKQSGGDIVHNAHNTKRGVAAFDDILSALSDAEDIARRLAEAQGTGSTSSVPGTRDIHFVHSFVVYQLLARRIERDLTLVDALVATTTPSKGTEKAKETSTVGSQAKIASNKSPKLPPRKPEHADARVNPAIVKMLDTVLQSLGQMRTLSVVDENPDLANAIEGRLAFTKGHRCVCLARAHAAVKQYAQAVSLTQRAQLYVREASPFLTLTEPAEDALDSSNPSFYRITHATVDDLQSALTADEARFKRDWFLHNGGTATTEKDPSRKPKFFDIAMNYVSLDMDRLYERAGKVPSNAPSVVVAPAIEKAASSQAKARVDAPERVATPEPEAASKGGLSSLLGGWWGRN